MSKIRSFWLFCIYKRHGTCRLMHPFSFYLSIQNRWAYVYHSCCFRFFFIQTHKYWWLLNSFWHDCNSITYTHAGSRAHVRPFAALFALLPQRNISSNDITLKIDSCFLMFEFWDKYIYFCREWEAYIRNALLLLLLMLSPRNISMEFE